MRTITGLPRLLLMSVLVVAASTQPVFLLGAAFIDMRGDFGYGPAGLGALTSTFFLTASLTSAPLGRLVERIGWRRAVRINAIASAAVVLSIAVAAHTTAVLAALLVAGGAVYGFANPAANKALAERVDPRHRALVFGLKHAGIPSSTLLAGLAVPALITTFGWRVAYSAAALLLLPLLAAVPRAAPDEKQAEPIRDVRRSVAPLSSLQLVALAGSAALASLAAIALATYLVAAGVEIGFSESAAGVLLFAGSAVSIAGRVVAGYTTDRIHGRGFESMAVLTGVGAVVFAIVGAVSGPVWAMLMLAAFATGWGWPGLMTYTVVNANVGSVAASSAITQAGVFVGAGLGPLALGAVVDGLGFDAAWIIVAVALTVATIGFAALGRLTVARSAPGRP